MSAVAAALEIRCPNSKHPRKEHTSEGNITHSDVAIAVIGYATQARASTTAWFMTYRFGTVMSSCLWHMSTQSIHMLATAPGRHSVISAMLAPVTNIVHQLGLFGQ